MREHLDFYSVDELAEIIRRNAAKLSVTITEDASVEIARRSRGTPRIANTAYVGCAITRRARATARSTGWSPMPRWTFKGWIPQGLDSQDRKYLETIARVFHGGPVGADAIAHTMNAPVDTLVDEVEPYLLRTEFVVRTPRGRKITATGLSTLGYRTARGHGAAALVLQPASNRAADCC